MDQETLELIFQIATVILYRNSSKHTTDCSRRTIEYRHQNFDPLKKGAIYTFLREVCSHEESILVQKLLNSDEVDKVNTVYLEYIISDFKCHSCREVSQVLLYNDEKKFKEYIVDYFANKPYITYSLFVKINKIDSLYSLLDICRSIAYAKNIKVFGSAAIPILNRNSIDDERPILPNDLDLTTDRNTFSDYILDISLLFTVKKTPSVYSILSYTVSHNEFMLKIDFMGTNLMHHLQPDFDVCSLVSYVKSDNSQKIKRLEVRGDSLMDIDEILNNISERKINIISKKPTTLHDLIVLVKTFIRARNKSINGWKVQAMPYHLTEFVAYPCTKSYFVESISKTTNLNNHVISVVEQYLGANFSDIDTEAEDIGNYYWLFVNPCCKRTESIHEVLSFMKRHKYIHNTQEIIEFMRCDNCFNRAIEVD